MDKRRQITSQQGSGRGFQHGRAQVLPTDPLARDNAAAKRDTAALSEVSGKNMVEHITYLNGAHPVEAATV